MCRGYQQRQPREAVTAAKTPVPAVCGARGQKAEITIWELLKAERHFGGGAVWKRTGPLEWKSVYRTSSFLAVKALIYKWMWELDYKESWAPKNCCFWTVVLEKTLESPLDCKEIKPIHLKGDQSWIFIGRTDAKAETPILWPPDGKKWLIWKNPDAGKDWRREEKGTTEDEMVGWHHQLEGHEFE